MATGKTFGKFRLNAPQSCVRRQESAILRQTPAPMVWSRASAARNAASVSALPDALSSARGTGNAGSRRGRGRIDDSPPAGWPRPPRVAALAVGAGCRLARRRSSEASSRSRSRVNSAWAGCSRAVAGFEASGEWAVPPSRPGGRSGTRSLERMRSATSGARRAPGGGSQPKPASSPPRSSSTLIGRGGRAARSLRPRVTLRAIAMPASPPASAPASAIPPIAAGPSGGRAAGISPATPLDTSSCSSSPGGTSRLPRPSRAANKVATMAANAGCRLIEDRPARAVPKLSKANSATCRSCQSSSWQPHPRPNGLAAAGSPREE
jgi:hypothetical protein